MKVDVMTDAEYRAVLRTDFISFIERSFYELNPQTDLLLAPYIEYLAAKLEDCRHGRIQRLIITLPPRYLKSHCASVAFVAWLLGQQPALSVICVSYAQDFADKLALDCRKILQSSWYQALFPTRLAPDKQAVNDFMTVQGGGRMSTSVGGVLTGRGADILIIDDPLKPEDALSEVKRNGVNNWYDSTLLSRLNNKVTGRIIVIMQRLHQDDLVGHVLAQEAWEVVSFPAIAESDECRPYATVFGPGQFSRQEGEPLHAERENLAMLKATQERIGAYNFASQYQQNPTPVGGALIKSHWILTYDQEPPREGGYLIQSWDTASKATELSDYSVCTTWCLLNDRYYLLDVFRKRLNYPELKAAVVALNRRFKPNKVLIEDKASGMALIQELKSEGPVPVVAYAIPAQMDKVMRLHAQSDLFEQGRIWVPKQAVWLSDYLAELTSFPGSKYDDQVDSTTQALDYGRTQYSRNLHLWIKLGGG